MTQYHEMNIFLTWCYISSRYCSKKNLTWYLQWHWACAEHCLRMGITQVQGHSMFSKQDCHGLYTEYTLKETDILLQTCSSLNPFISDLHIILSKLWGSELATDSIKLLETWYPELSIQSAYAHQGYFRGSNDMLNSDFSQHSPETFIILGRKRVVT